VQSGEDTSRPNISKHSTSLSSLCSEGNHPYLMGILFCVSVGTCRLELYITQQVHLHGADVGSR